jgi:uncharacterized membrane-anchored protein YhcB (DUF1043 family)
VIKEKALTLLFVVFTVFTGHTQIKLLNNSPEFRQALDKILADYCNQFRNLKGEVVVENPESSEFISTVTLPGSEECTIIQMRNTVHETRAFQALMLSTDDYDAASKKYKQLYAHLHNASVRLDNGGGRYTIKGEMEKPSEDKDIISTIFDISPGTNFNKNVHLELSMTYELMEWKVRIAVYDKVDDDKVRPSAN